MSIQDQNLRLRAIEVSQIVLSSDLDPWERQDVEEDSHWAAFLIYRELPPSKRTFRACAEQLAGRKLTSTPDWISQAAYNNRWAERVAPYDRYRDANMRMQLEERILAQRLAMADLADTLLRKVMEAAKAIQAVIEVDETDSDGNVNKKIISRLNPTAISQLSNVAMNLEKLALGLEDNKQQGKIHVEQTYIQIGADSQLIKRAAEVVEEHRRIVDAVPFDIVSVRESDASRSLDTGHADVG